MCCESNDLSCVELICFFHIFLFFVSFVGFVFVFLFDVSFWMQHCLYVFVTFFFCFFYDYVSFTCRLIWAFRVSSSDFSCVLTVCLFAQWFS